MKILPIFLIVLSLTLLLVSCAKVISESEELHTVIIVDSYHKSAWLQTVRCGKVTTYMTHPAKHIVTVMFNGEEYNIDNYDIYYQFKDKINAPATGTFNVKIYDDNTIEYKLINLEE